MSAYISDLTPEELKRNFDIYDKDGSGKIQIGEMKNLFARNGAELTESAQQYLWAKYDKNKDGMIDYYEFVEYLTGKSYNPPAGSERQVTSTAAGYTQFQDEFHKGYLDGYKEGYLKGLQKFKELKAAGKLPTLQTSQTISSQQSNKNTQQNSPQKDTGGWQQAIEGQSNNAGSQRARPVATAAPQSGPNWQQTMSQHIHNVGTQDQHHQVTGQAPNPQQGQTQADLQHIMGTHISTVGQQGLTQGKQVPQEQTEASATQGVAPVQPGQETPRKTTSGDAIETTN